MKTFYEEKNGNDNNSLDAQTKAIQDGKIQLPDQFRGKLNNKTAPKY